MLGMMVLTTSPHLYSLLDGEMADAALVGQPEEGFTTNHLLDITSTLYHSCIHADTQP